MNTCKMLSIMLGHSTHYNCYLLFLKFALGNIENFYTQKKKGIISLNKIICLNKRKEPSSCKKAKIVKEKSKYHSKNYPLAAPKVNTEDRNWIIILVIYRLNSLWSNRLENQGEEITFNPMT